MEHHDIDDVHTLGLVTNYRNGHIHIHNDVRQIAVYASTPAGDFLGWGWTETDNGPAESRTWIDFARMLATAAQSAPVATK